MQTFWVAAAAVLLSCGLAQAAEPGGLNNGELGGLNNGMPAAGQTTIGVGLICDTPEQAERFVTLRADMTAESDDNTALTEKFQIQGVPTIVLLDTAGNEVDRLVGYVGPEELLARLRRVR